MAASNVSAALTAQATKLDIIPDVISALDKDVTLQMSFEYEAIGKLKGMGSYVLTPTKVASSPNIYIEGEPSPTTHQQDSHGNYYYALVMTDPDAPSRKVRCISCA